MKYLRNTLFCLFILPLSLIARQDVEMADALRQSGKIYVVLAVIATIFLGIVFYLWHLHKKVDKLLSEQDEKPSMS